MQENYLVSGWEEALTLELKIEEDGKNYMKGIELHTKRRLNRLQRDFGQVRTDVLKKLSEFITIRFSLQTDGICELLKPFFELRSNQQNVRQVHRILAPDLDGTELYMQFREVCKNAELKSLSLNRLMQYFATAHNAHEFSVIKIVLARLLAATPHSADVERSISASNNLKSRLRSRMKLKTENNYLFIYFNMPAFIS